MSEPTSLAEHAFRRAVGKRCSLTMDGKTFIGRVLPGLSKPSHFAPRFRLRARDTYYVLLSLAPRLKLLPPAKVRIVRRKRA